MDVTAKKAGTTRPEHQPPLLSIVCPAYNQEAFIAQTLDGFLSQQTSFSYEILVHDDASTDGTARIIAQYTERHPTIIRAFYQQTNQYSQGIPCVPNLFAKARGRYIAYCEADDYWTDPRKLQLQVDFLESHPDYVITYHDAFAFDENGQYGIQLQGDLRADATSLELQGAPHFDPDHLLSQRVQRHAARTAYSHRAVERPVLVVAAGGLRQGQVHRRDQAGCLPIASGRRVLDAQRQTQVAHESADLFEPGQLLQPPG